MHFVVSLAEAGNVEEMQAMLEAEPEHAQELLFGERVGVENGKYSAWSYSTWLCMFDQHRDGAQRVVEWLLERGHEADLWSAIALRDSSALKKILKETPELSRAEHPLFGDTALALAPPELRPLLLEHGADDGSISVAMLLGDADRVLRIVRKHPGLIEDADRGREILMGALTNGLDDLACKLIELGVETADGEGDYSLLSMAATWGAPRATRALIAAGSDPNRRVGIFTPLSMCVSRSVATPKVVADVVQGLLEGGAEVRRTRIEGRSLLQWCEEKGLDEAGRLIREASRRRGR